MNHSFQPSQINKKLCNACKRTEFEHSDLVACEACMNFGSCEIFNNMLLCRECYAKELMMANHVSIVNSVPVNTTLSPEQSRELIQADINEIAVLETRVSDSGVEITTKYDYALADLPLNGNEFFNNKMISIKELENKINNDDAVTNKKYFLAEQLKFRYLSLRKTLLEVTEIQLQAKSEQAAIQVSLNQLAARLTAEERAKLKIEHPDYVASVAPEKVKKVRVSKAEQQAENYARIMGITVEHAKKLLAQSLKEAQHMSGLSCSCAETPGLCRMHPK
jgi:hypothetical protein